MPGGPLNLNYTNLPRLCSPRESSPSGKIPTVEPGIELGTSWLLGHEAGHFIVNVYYSGYYSVLMCGGGFILRKGH